MVRRSSVTWRSVTVDISPARFLHDIDLAEETRNLNPAERRQARRMTVKPWYTEFVAAPVRLTIGRGDGGAPETYDGTGTVEFMDFHINPM